MKRGLALGALVIGLLVAAGPAHAEGCAFSFGGTCLIPGGTATATPTPSPSPVPTSQPAPVTQPLQQVTEAAKPATQPAVNVLEDLLLEKVNAERRLAGLAPLAINAWARSTAREHSGRMAQANDLWHNSAYMSQGRAAMGASLLGENVAMGTVLDAAHAQLMGSEPHRRNLLEARFTHVGIGIAQGAGFLYVTQDLARIAGAAPPSSPPAPPAAAPRPAPAKPAAVQAPAPPPAPAETAPPVAEAPQASAPAPVVTPAAEPAPEPVSVPARPAGHSLPTTTLLLLAAFGFATLAFGRRLVAFSTHAVRR